MDNRFYEQQISANFCQLSCKIYSGVVNEYTIQLRIKNNFTELNVAIVAK